ncbi:hypothetical protein [Ectopseudomonas khazarica]|uniref:hypothetical protein n=1 Tax=Ectopseudomonas khazarica TaxID=2502979 RepID=UPI0037CC139C
MTDIPRYNAPRGTTLCEAVGGELVMADDHESQVSALRAALHSCAKASSAAEVGLIVDEVLAPENQRVVPAEPLLASRHPFDRPSVLKDCDVEYSAGAQLPSIRRQREKLLADVEAGIADQLVRDRLVALGWTPPGEQQEAVHWRAVLSPAEMPMQLNIHEHVAGFTDRRKAEDWIAARLQMDGWHYTLEALYPGPQPSKVNRIPAGLYAELEALRTLRDATGVYLQGYMRDEIEDEDNCVTEDQHDAACSVKSALDNARALEWKARGDA